MTSPTPPSVPPARPTEFPWGFVLRLACVLLILAPAFLIARDRYDISVLDSVLRAPVLTVALIADWILPTDWIARSVTFGSDYPVGWAIGTGLLSVVLWFKILAFLSKSR